MKEYIVTHFYAIVSVRVADIEVQQSLTIQLHYVNLLLVKPIHKPWLNTKKAQRSEFNIFIIFVVIQLPVRSLLCIRFVGETKEETENAQKVFDIEAK